MEFKNIMVFSYTVFAVTALICMLKEHIGGRNLTVKDLLYCVLFSAVPVLNIFTVCMYASIYIANSPKIIKTLHAMTAPYRAIRDKVKKIMQYPIISGEKDDQI